MGDNESISGHTRSEFADGMKHRIATMIKDLPRGNDPLPIIDVRSSDGTATVIGVPMTPESKKTIYETLPPMIAKLKPKYIGYFSTAWTVTGAEWTPGQNLATHPHRKEIAILITSSAFEMVSEIAEVLRGGDTLMLSEWTSLPSTMTGRLCELINNSFDLSFGVEVK